MVVSLPPLHPFWYLEYVYDSRDSSNNFGPRGGPGSDSHMEGWQGGRSLILVAMTPYFLVPDLRNSTQWFWVSSPQSKSRCYWSDFCLCPWQQWDSAISFSIGDGVAVGVLRVWPIYELVLMPETGHYKTRSTPSQIQHMRYAEGEGTAPAGEGFPSQAQWIDFGLPSSESIWKLRPSGACL